VPLKDLIPTAERWANEIMECSPISVQASKEVALGTLGISLEESMNRGHPAVSRLMKSKDAIEGPLAFSQKRKPNWQNE